MKHAFVVVVFLFQAMTLFAQRQEGTYSRDAVGEKTYPAAPRLAERVAAAPAVTLDAATVAVPGKVEEITRWNQEGRRPAKNGFTRSLIDPIAVRIDSGTASAAKAATFARGVVATSERGLVWSGIVHVRAAYRLRLRLDEVRLPAGAVLWVYGDGEKAIGFGEDLIDSQRSLWTPSVGGESIHLEVEIPHPQSANDGASFTIHEVLEIVGPPPAPALKAPAPNDASTCLLDATCVSASTNPHMEALRGATAHLQYVKGGSGYVCSGGLLTDSETTTFVPYLLTANHCFSESASASSLEAFWDYRRPTCNGTIPPFSSLARSNGSTLLATSSSSDFTFIRLNSAPAGRWLLGWDADTSVLTNGLALYRVSHPFPDDRVVPLPQSYSMSFLSTTAGTCLERPRPAYLYSNGGSGGLYGGSSGAPVVYIEPQSAYVVGQLRGGCGPEPSAGCDSRNSAVDGSFALTYDSIRQWVDGSPVQGSPCIASSTQVCLVNDRFGVRVTFNDGTTKNATAIKYTPTSALFWFFASTNIEVILKMIDACSFNQRYWVYSGGTTDQGVTITVTDSKTGTVKTYQNPRGQKYATITDGEAFATCP